MRRTLRYALISSIPLCIISAACFGNRPLPEVEQVIDVPEQYGQRAEQPPAVEQPPLQSWCSDFGSPGLQAHVSQAFDGNLDLLTSWARLSQSEAILRQTEANLYPTVDVDAQVSSSKQRAIGLAIDRPFTVEQYRASIGASYEVDLWGRLYAQRQAARLDVRAARADLETIALSLTSSVAEAWFDVLAERQRRELLESQIDLNERYVELLRLRLAQGVSSALDITQQQQQIASLIGQLESTDQARALAGQRLAVLLGQAPEDTEGRAPEVEDDELPELPPMPASGVPADLLERRPDLRAARLRMEAANRRIAVAVRARLPTLRLSASLFLQAFDIGSFLNEVLWSVGAQAAQPLIDGGLRAAEVDRAEAVQREALYTYADTLTTALSEVQGAMVSEHHQARLIEQLEKQREQADLALTLSRERYQRGALDFLRVLTALQSLQTLERQIVDAQRRQLSNRLTLCRALGGTWTRDLAPPSAPEAKAIE